MIARTSSMAKYTTATGLPWNVIQNTFARPLHVLPNVMMDGAVFFLIESVYLCMVSVQLCKFRCFCLCICAQQFVLVMVLPHQSILVVRTSSSWQQPILFLAPSFLRKIKGRNRSPNIVVLLFYAPPPSFRTIKVTFKHNLKES